ncbi:MAG: DUF371 domain-containing protein [Desulfurococcales archaeon]|nr:DUF371 domain-containing protein [Desulfurococcales archaeon]
MDGQKSNIVEELVGRWVKFRAWGHYNVRAAHRSTIELTKEESLTPRGDCIIGVKSQLAAKDLPQWFKNSARQDNSIIIAVFCSNGICDGVVGRGSPNLIFEDETRMILRRSTYIEPATIMIKASKAAIDLRRDLVNLLSDSKMLDVFMTVINLSH